MHGQALSLDNAGNTTREFIFAEDMARGLMACAGSGESGGVYNLATGVETRISRVAALIKEFTNSDSELIFGPPRDWDGSGRRFASTEKSKKDLGFSTNVDIENGLKITVGWFNENYDFISSCVQKHAKTMKQCDR